MRLRVFLSSTLRAYVPDYDPLEGVELAIEGKMSIAALCRQIKVPVDRIKLIMVNGKRQPFDYALKGGERVALFPPVGGG
ncbi:MAG: MoaD/ThiS family protein [Desulfatiglandaceae bacterium]